MTTLNQQVFGAGNTQFRAWSFGFGVELGMCLGFRGLGFSRFLGLGFRVLHLALRFKAQGLVVELEALK